MRLIKSKSYQDMSRMAANLISAQIIMKPNCVIGLATGASPIGTYKQLIEWYRKGDLDFSQVKTVNLDEYRGISKSNKNSYWYFMHKNLFQEINIKSENIYIPEGEDMNAEEVCKGYDHVITELGGIDLQLLGLGLDGHIGFNEPGVSFQLQTHVAELHKSTIQANQRFFEEDEEVPNQAYTVGIKSILQARKVVMIVSGKEKAEIVKKAFLGPVTSEVPASILQMHPDFTLVTDEEAGKYLVD